jgi:hypothetical protein
MTTDPYVPHFSPDDRTELPFAYPSAPSLTGARGRPPRGRPVDPERSRRGRTNRSRGNAIERWVCHLLGIARVGQFGGPEDGGRSDDWISVQVKSGGVYPERIDSLLRAIPERADRLRAVVHTDAPGPGHPRRALITLDLREFADWYGGRKP